MKMLKGVKGNFVRYMKISMYLEENKIVCHICRSKSVSLSFLFPVEHKKRCFEECSCCSFNYSKESELRLILSSIKVAKLCDIQVTDHVVIH